MSEVIKKNLKKPIPPSTRKRFPDYLRALQQLKQRGSVRVMSYQIGNICNVAPDTVRRDFMYVNHKGKTASGYDIDSLINAFNEELGTTNTDTKIILIGVGNMGQALLKYNFIPSHIGKIVCAYDIDVNKIGTCINGVPIFNITALKDTFPEDCNIAILAVPKEGIDEIVSRLVQLKIKAIINFSDGIPRKRNNVRIHQVDLAKIVSEILYDFKNNDIQID